MKVTYDRTKQEGSRVIDVQVRCADCQIPEYEQLDSTALYSLLAPKFLIKGGDGYNMLNNEQLSRTSYGKFAHYHLYCLTPEVSMLWKLFVLPKP